MWFPTTRTTADRSLEASQFQCGTSIMQIEMNLVLQKEIARLKQVETSQQRDTQHTLNALCMAVEQERDCRKLAAKEAANAQSARAEAASKAALQMQELKKHIRKAQTEAMHARGQVERLGCQLGAAHVLRLLAHVIARRSFARRQKGQLRQQNHCMLSKQQRWQRSSQP